MVYFNLDRAKYRYNIWSYTAANVSSASRALCVECTDERFTVALRTTETHIRIGVELIAGTGTLTDAEFTEIKNGISFYILTDSTLDNANYPINAQAVKKSALIYKGSIENNTDINTVVEQGFYNLTSGNSYTNSPVATGFLFVYRAGISIMQIAYDYGTVTTYIPNVYRRNGSITSNSPTITSTWKKQTRNRKTQIKMACFGASEMWGRDGNSTNQIEEQYRIPSILAHNLNIETTNYGVGSQGYIGLIPEKAYDNISSKDLTAFNTMIMMYGGNDGYADLGDVDSSDESTIMGQFNKIINYVYEQNPIMRLIVISPMNGRNVGSFPKYWYGERSHPDGYVSRQTLSDTLKARCEYFNIPYIEQTNSPVNGFTIRNQQIMGDDGVHLTLEGYKRVGEWLSGEIARIIG